MVQMNVRNGLKKNVVESKQVTEEIKVTMKELHIIMATINPTLPKNKFLLSRPWKTTMSIFIMTLSERNMYVTIYTILLQVPLLSL